MSSPQETKSTIDSEETDTLQKLKDRAERNRQKALLLKKSKLVAHPYAKGYELLVPH